MYRVYEYPSKTVPYKHVYLKRCPSLTHKLKAPLAENLTAAELNSLSILQELERKEKSKQNISRARRVVRDLILCNDFVFFCTFTFDANKIDRFNYEDCRKKLTKFFNNFKSRYAPDFKYLIIPEFHDDGAVHFHGVLSGMPEGEIVVPKTVLYRDRFTDELKQIPNKHNYHAWPRYQKAFGHFNCSRIINHDACAFYITKYVTKDLCDMPLGRSVYMCSQGLTRPQLVYSCDDMPLVFEPAYENEYVAVAFDNDTFVRTPVVDYSWTEFDEVGQMWPEFAFAFDGVQLRMGDSIGF